MEFKTCAQCAIGIEAKGIHFRGLDFCSDECCEEYEERLAASGEPDEIDLDEDDLDDELGYRGDDDDDGDGLDDDFDIRPEDF